MIIQKFITKNLQQCRFGSDRDQIIYFFLLDREKRDLCKASVMFCYSIVIVTKGTSTEQLFSSSQKRKKKTNYFFVF